MKRQVKYGAPVTRQGDGAPVPINCAAEYIYADIWDEQHGCSAFPCGARGYIVLSLGDVWARLFSPVTLDCYRMPIDAYDRLKPIAGATFNPPAMLARMQANRTAAQRYGHFDGGRAFEEAERLLQPDEPEVVEW